MKRPPIPILFLFSVCCAPLLHAQDPSEKVREIERKVLMKQHRDAVHALAGSARENNNPEKIGQQLHWLTLVNNRIEGGGRMDAASREEMVRSAHTLNELAWRMIAPREASARTPDIALKLATIAIELGGTDRELNASLLETRARALFMMDRRDEAVMEQEKAVAAATQPKETARGQNTLAAYRRNELPPVERPTAVAAKPAADPAKQENGTAYITGKLKRIILPDVDFEDASMDEVAEFLMKQVHTLDTEEADLSRRGLKFVVVRAPGASPGGSPAGTPDGQQMRVRGLHLRHVPVDVALRYICQMTGGRYRVDEHEVSFLPPDMGLEILTRTFRVPPDFISKLAPGVAAGTASGDPAARPSVMEAFKAVGVVFPEGSSASLDESGLLLVRNTSAQLDSIERLIGLIPQDTLEGEQPVVTPPATAMDEPSSGVQYIVEKLRTIIVPSVAFDDVSLEEAVDFLRKQSIELDVLEPDPGRKGLN
ncbi:MAG: tetratricopeptide repeat protein, partial [Verrucomicrobiaceae bacterium]